MTKVLQKKDRVSETINATLEDIRNLYVVTILDRVIGHFQKKLFGKEEEFQNGAHEVRKKHLEAVNCEYSWGDSISSPTVETIDGIAVNLTKVLEILGQKSMYSKDELLEELCYKYDKGKGGEFTIIPVLQKKVRTFWIYFE